MVGDLSRDGWGVTKVVELLSRAQMLEKSFEISVIGVASSRWLNIDKDLWKGGSVEALWSFGAARHTLMPLLIPKLFSLRPNVIHCHGFWTAHVALSFIVARLTGAKFVLSTHGMLKPRSMLKSRMKKKLFLVFFYKYILRRTDLFNCGSHEEAQAIERLIGEDINCYTTRNGVDSTNSEVRQVPQDVRRVLFVGRFEEKKGIIALLDAWQIFREANGVGDIYLQLIGLGNDSYSLDVLRHSKKIRDLKISKPVYGKQLNQIISSSFLLVVPSECEGWPLICAEALGVGTPVLFTSGSPIQDVVDFGAGLSVKYGVESLVEGLIYFFQLSDREWFRYSRKAREYSQLNLEWPRIAEQHLSAYMATE